MKITINILPAIVAVSAFAIAYSISTGTLQSIVPFAGAANEAATMLVAFMIGAGSLICTFEKVNK
jgi:hypothetical protein